MAVDRYSHVHRSCSVRKPSVWAVCPVAARESAVPGNDTGGRRYAGAGYSGTEKARAYEAMGTYTYIGSCKVTAYCCEPYEHICGTGDGLTATGIPVTPGIVAVDPEVIPLGSTVVIDGQRYLAADTGGMVKGLHVDIAVPTHEEAVAFGSQAAEVWIIPQDGGDTP